MKSPEKLHKELTEKLITENYIDLNPITTFEATPKADFETKFAQFLAEKKGEELKPVVNTDESINTLKDSEGISADSKAKFEGKGFQASYKVDKTLENIDSHNYDYDTTIENINNVNGEELLKGVQLETSYNSELTLDEAKELVIKNLSKDPLHYVKEGQFGVKGLGYTEAKTQKVDGKHAASGYSEKLKDSDNTFDLVKENYSFDEARERAIEASQREAGIEEDKRPDYPDVDGDGDTKEPMEKALKDKKEKKKRMKKESIDSKLAEIGKEAEAVKLEAQLDFLHDHIQEKVNRVSSIQEDENLSELIDKVKMKQMQKEIKLLEKRKAKMEKIYEKSCGKKYAKKEMVDENEVESINEIGANDMVVSYRDEEKIPIKFTGFEAFDGRDGGQDTTDNQGRFVVRMKAERVDGQKLAGKDKFSVQVVTDPGVSKITPDGTIPFPDHDRYSSPEVVDYGNTIKYIKDNI
jgi:hypothetical protein